LRCNATTNREQRTVNFEPKEQGRSGNSNPSGLRFPLATLFAGHPRAGSLCSKGTSAPSGLEASRPVLMIFRDAVSEKCRLSRKFFPHLRVTLVTPG
jgi:hypothetical protein